MNRQQRHAAGKGQSNQRVVLTGLVAHFENGQYTSLDITKIQIVDKETGRPLFDEVLEPIAAEIKARTPHQEFADEPNAQDYAVEFDTPEGKMIYVKKGNWSGVKPA